MASGQGDCYQLQPSSVIGLRSAMMAARPGDLILRSRAVRLRELSLYSLAEIMAFHQCTTALVRRRIDII